MDCIWKFNLKTSFLCQHSTKALCHLHSEGSKLHNGWCVSVGYMVHVYTYMLLQKQKKIHRTCPDLAHFSETDVNMKIQIWMANWEYRSQYHNIYVYTDMIYIHLYNLKFLWQIVYSITYFEWHLSWVITWHSGTWIPVNKEAKNGSNCIWLEITHIKPVFAPKDMVPINGEERKWYGVLFYIKYPIGKGTIGYRSMKKLNMVSNVFGSKSLTLGKLIHPMQRYYSIMKVNRMVAAICGLQSFISSQGQSKQKGSCHIGFDISHIKSTFAPYILRQLVASGALNVLWMVTCQIEWLLKVSSTELLLK